MQAFMAPLATSPGPDSDREELIEVTDDHPMTAADQRSTPSPRAPQQHPSLHPSRNHHPQTPNNNFHPRHQPQHPHQHQPHPLSVEVLSRSKTNASPPRDYPPLSGSPHEDCGSSGMGCNNNSNNSLKRKAESPPTSPATEHRRESPGAGGLHSPTHDHHRGGLSSPDSGSGSGSDAPSNPKGEFCE